MQTDQDIDTWYEDTKDTAFRAYIKAIDAHMGESERQARFLLAMKKIHNQYRSKHVFLMRRTFVLHNLHSALTIIFSPLTFLWKLLRLCAFTCSSFVKNRYDQAISWYRYGPKLLHETNAYIRKTERELKYLPLQKSVGGAFRPYFIMVKRPMYRFHAGIHARLAQLMANAKANVKYYKEITGKFLAKSLSGYLICQGYAIRTVKWILGTIKAMFHAPKRILGWLKEKLNPEDI